MSGAVANFCGFDGEAPKGGGAGVDYKFSPPFAFGPAPPRATVDPNFRGVQAPYGRECDDQPAARRRKQHKPFCAPYGRDCDGNFVDEADHSVKTKLHEDAPTACWGDKLKDCSGARKTWGALKAKNEGGNTRPWKTDSEMAAERAQAERDLAGAAGVYAFSRTTQPSAADSGAVAAAPGGPVNADWDHKTCFQRPNSAVGAPRQQADHEAQLVKRQHQGRVSAFLF